MSVRGEIEGCVLCADRFAATKTAHAPRPVAWFNGRPKIVIAGQAPGLRVHESGRPFTDPSGDRLRDWMGIDDATFYDRDRIAVVPMAFCFPGYNAKGADLPPPPICARTWRARVMDHLGTPPLMILVGAYAQKWHLGDKISVVDRVSDWQRYAPRVFPLPHPSWRNTSWIKRNPWFSTDVLPALKSRVREVLDD